MENQLGNVSNQYRIIYLLEQLVGSSTGGSVAPQTYAISDSDESATSPKYYGFLKPDGTWYILKVVVASGISAFTYVAGTTGGYAAAWTARASQTYATYDVTF